MVLGWRKTDRRRISRNRQDAVSSGLVCVSISDRLNLAEPEVAAALARRPYRLFASHQLTALIGRASDHALLEVYK